MVSAEHQIEQRLLPCAVMVTFHPTAETSNAVEAAQAACAEVIIVDNTETRALPEALMRFADCGGLIVRSSRNCGIGAAVNRGVKHAALIGHKRVLLLDQDSLVDASIAGVLNDIYDRSEVQRIAAVGARHRDLYTRSESARQGRRISDSLRVVKTVQTSGSLVDIETFAQLGGYREDLFIDDVDHEFCLRAGARGYFVLQTDRILFRHALGKRSHHRFLLKTLSTYNHSPSRHYYMTRNLVVLAREYGLAEPRWVAFGVLNRFKTLVKAFIWEDERAAKFMANVIGLWHGVLGHTGPLCR